MGSNIESIKSMMEYNKNTTIDEFESIEFGKYFKYENDDKKYPIEFVILEKDETNRQALLVSKNVIDCIPYNEDGNSCTWEDSSIRKFLNEDFINIAFSEEEKQKILDMTLINSNNEFYDMKVMGGNNTYDKIFCLSVNECIGFFNIDIREKSDF